MKSWFSGNIRVKFTHNVEMVEKFTVKFAKKFDCQHLVKGLLLLPWNGGIITIVGFPEYYLCLLGETEIHQLLLRILYRFRLNIYEDRQFAVLSFSLESFIAFFHNRY